MDKSELEEPTPNKSILDNVFAQMGVVGIAIWIVVSGTLNVLEAILPRWLLRDLDGSLYPIFIVGLCFEGVLVFVGVAQLLEFEKRNNR